MSDALRVLEYLDTFGQLNSAAAAKVTMELYRLEHGNFSKCEGRGHRRFRIQDRFRARLPNLLWQGWRPNHHLARRQ